MWLSVVLLTGTLVDSDWVVCTVTTDSAWVVCTVLLSSMVVSLGRQHVL